MIMMFEQLQDKILDWADERGILDNSNPLKQLEKTQEELDETKEALEKIQNLKNEDFFIDVGNEDVLRNQYNKEVADGIGDMLVTIIILAELTGLDSVECLRLAYDEIKDRKGKMENGLFVKD